MQPVCLTTMRHLEDIEASAACEEAEIEARSGRTPPALRIVLTEWPLVSALMVKTLAGAGRAAVQRYLAWMEGWGLIRDLTGQGRYRMWGTTY
jgi:hypothetical protein